MALRDDLARAADLVVGAGDTAYVTGFLRGLARSTGDAALEAAAIRAKGEAGRRALSELIAQRLMAFQPV